LTDTLLGLLTVENLLVVLITFTGGFVRGYTGFGNGLVMAPLLSLFWGPVEAIAVTVGLGFAGLVQIVRPAIPLVVWREVGPMTFAALVFTPIGTYFLVSLDPEIVKKIIAAAVLVVTLITLRGWNYTGPRGPIPSIMAGGLGAMINGVAGVGGPPIVLYLMSAREDARVLRANIVIIMGIMGIAVFLSIITAGEMSAHSLLRIAGLVVPFGGGVWLGARMFNVLPGKVFRLIILWMLVAISVSILVAS